MELWTIGYSAWPVATRAEGLIAALAAHRITRLIDVRLNPCASDPVPGRPYGPKPWNLQAGPGGIVELLAAARVAYEWIVELGNPQRQDHAMTVLRAHLADPTGGWPVHRGLERLAGRVRGPGQRIALLCTCADAGQCHRTVIARALSERHFGAALAIHAIGRAR